MNMQANKLLWKNKLRMMKGTLRHTWQSAIGLMIVVVVMLYQFFFVVVEAEYGIVVSPRGTFYVLLAVAAFNFFRVCLSQTPVFRIEAASLLLTYNTASFKKLLRRRMWLSVALAVFSASFIAYVLSGFQCNAVLGSMSILLTLYICNSTFLSWIGYHVKKKLRVVVFLHFAACTVMLFLKSWLSAGILAFSLCALMRYVHRFLKLDLPKYNKRLQFLDASSAAVSQHDFAKMSQMAEENRPSMVQEPMFQHFRASKKTALWIKSLLEILRMQKQLLAMLALLLLGGWIVSQTELLAFVPLLDDPAIANILAALCTVAAFGALDQILIKQAETVSEKRALGLSLPLTTTQIFVSYGLPAALLNLLLTMLTGILYQRFFLRLLLLWIAETGAYCVMSYAAMQQMKCRNEVSMAANMLLLGAVYFCLII